MRNKLLVIVSVVSLAVAAFTIVGGPGATGARRPIRHDFTFFETSTVGDGGECQGPGKFEIAGLFQAQSASQIQITFADGDLIGYPLAAGQTLNVNEFAGGNPEVDSDIKVKLVSGSFTGWMSARGIGVTCNGL